MVMPRSFSISIESRTCSVISRAERPPVCWISRSDRVDLPWSMWATMEKLRMRSLGVMIQRGGYSSPVFEPSLGAEVWSASKGGRRRNSDSPLPCGAGLGVGGSGGDLSGEAAARTPTPTRPAGGRESMRASAGLLALSLRAPRDLALRSHLTPCPLSLKERGSTWHDG